MTIQPLPPSPIARPADVRRASTQDHFAALRPYPKKSTLLVLLAVLVAAWTVQHGVLGPRPLIPALVAWMVWAIYRLPASRRLATAVWGVTGLFVLALATAFSIAPTIAPRASHATTDQILAAVCQGLMAWSVMIWYTRETDSRSQWQPPIRVPAALVLAATAAMVAAHVVFVGHYRLGVDETMYVLQARWMSEPGFGRRVPLDLIEHFRLGFTFLQGDRQVVQYPPGWPALIAVANLAHARMLLAPLLGASVLACLYRLGTRLHSRAAGVIALTLVGTQHWFLEFHSSLLSHAASTAALVAAAWVLVDHDDPRRHPSAWRAGIAGLFVAFTVTVRPVTGVLIGLSLGLWVLMRSSADWRDKIRLAVFSAVGAVPAIAALLAYNHATTGDPFVLGYTATRGSLQNLGFGLRGEPGFMFTPLRAMELSFTVARDVLRDSIATGLLVPFMWVGVVHGARIRWGVVAAFLALPLAMVFYFSNRIRVQFELIPFLLLGVAVLVAHAGRKVWLLVAFAAAANLMLTPRWAQGDLSRPYRQFASTMEELAARSKRGERLLVFFDQNNAWSARTSAVSLLNLDGVLLVRHRGESDSLVMRQFPNYTPLRLTYQGDGRPGLITPADEPATQEPKP